MIASERVSPEGVAKRSSHLRLLHHHLHRRLVVTLAPTLVTLFLAPLASAQSSSVAEALFTDGKKLMAEGKFAEACPKLAESNRLDPGAGALTALALCHKGEGKTASAWSEFKDVISLSRRDGRKDREQVALDNISELEPKLSRLKIEVSAAASSQNVEVRLDGILMQSVTFGQAFPVDPGMHRVDARAPGKKSFETSVKVEGDRDEKSVEIPALVDAPQSAAVAGPSSSNANASDAANGRGGGSTQRTIGYAVGGLGLVAVGVGTVFGIQALSKNSESNDLCSGIVCSNPEGLKANEDARSSATISNIAIIGGVVALVGGVVLILTAPSSSARTGVVTAPARKSAWRLSPSTDARGTSSLWLSGTF